MSAESHTVWGALRRDRGGIASLAVLALIALACLFGPMLSPHPYDRVFPDYVLTPASLAAHPTPSERDESVVTLAMRMHASVHLDMRSDGLVAVVTDDKPIDIRVLRALGRSGVLQPVDAPAVAGDGRRLEQPVTLKSEHFLFGTDANGRDLLTRVLIAGRLSLAVGVLASAVALGIGVVYGAIAGYLGGRTDALMMRAVDIIYALPFIFFVIVLVVLFGRTLVLIFVAIGAVEWLDMARIVRGQTLSLKRREYVLAAQALGASDRAILTRHIVPNMSGPIIAYLGLLVPRVILAESFLSFLGLGVQEPLTSWGILIADGARNVQSALHLLVFPALLLAITLIAATQLGEALRRAADAGRT
ncbi:ABC transporter permease [Beijerinckia sp. L45]|uniref:ABC transporter permease n=1 Tax=Beijerinckia sp. L45 TaxID=1641855 RepID=UPI00131AB3BB|nr:ABC transporter permease subunit [Beijerinckia sp. L45]